MSLIQSFWSKPAIENRWNIKNQLESNLWIMALSCVYAKKNNIPLIMHTDDFGKELLSYLPYTEIRLTLNQIPENTPAGQWAISKMYAQRASNLGDIHIDNDVFIKKRSLYEMMANKPYDAIVQSLEKTDGPLYVEAKKIIEPLTNQKVMDFQTPYAFNCGIIGFKNQQLKDRYLNDYFKFYQELNSNPELNNWLLTEKELTAELLIEQAHLFEITDNKHVLCLLMKKESAKELGYQHLIGKSKYFVINQVKQLLFKLDSDIYYKTQEIIEKYGNQNKET